MRNVYKLIIVLDVLSGLAVGAAILSIVEHESLVSYGLKEFPSGFAWVLCAYALLAALCGSLALVVSRHPVWWTAIPGLLIAVCSAALSAGALYALEVKYEKGDSNLGRLAQYQKSRAEWEHRSEVLRRGILRAARLEPLPERTPMHPVRHSHRVREGFSVENVTLETTPGFFLPANLYIPALAAATRRAPVVLLAQGHFPDGRFNPNTQILAANLARMGAIVIAYDMVGRGESSQLQHEHHEALRLQLWNSIRVLDFALSLPEADPERVAMTGASGGGTQTFLCTAIDERISVSAPVVMVSSWVYGGCACESGLPIHRGSGYATNNAEIAALAAPRPQLVVSIGDDWTRTVPVHEYPFIQRVYNLYGAESSVENVHLPDEEHDYGPGKRRAVYEFLRKHLGLHDDPSGVSAGEEPEYDEVEPMDLMRAFTDDNPVPESAIRNWGELSLQTESN